MSVKDIMMSAAGAIGDKTYIEDVFSTYSYTGNGYVSNNVPTLQTINNGMQLRSIGASYNFSTPTSTGTSFSNLSITGFARHAASGLCVMVASHSSTVGLGAIFTSPDGTTWTSQGNKGFAARGVAVNSSGLFVAIGNDVGSNPVLYTSTDGITWTQRALTGWSTTIPTDIVVNSSGTFVIAGNTGSGVYVASSTDGITWTTSPTYINTFNWSSLSLKKLAVQGNGVYIYCSGYASYNNPYQLLYSYAADGISFGTINSLGGSSPRIISSASDGTNSLAMGYNESTYAPIYVYNGGGPTTIPEAENIYFYGIAAKGPNEFVAVGYERFSPYAPVSITYKDGQWSIPTRMNSSSSTAFMNFVYYDGSGFKSIGWDSSLNIVTSSSTSITPAVQDNGGLVWLKCRSSYTNTEHGLYHTKLGYSNLNSANGATLIDYNSGIIEFRSNGFKLSTGFNAPPQSYISWTFREASKFFNTVVYTGNSTSGRQVAHNLSATPGMIIVKNISDPYDWYVYHRGSNGGVNPQNYRLRLNYSEAQNSSNPSAWNNTAPSSTHFTLNDEFAVNQTSKTYIAYLFAHDPSPDGIIQCGSYTGNGSNTGPSINLGWEPQYLMIKNTSGTGDWVIIDSMRGPMKYMLANSNIIDSTTNFVAPLPTGFQIITSSAQVNTSGSNYIYMAIRRGPMRTPTTGTSVFNASTVTSPGTASTGFPVDLVIGKAPLMNGRSHYVFDRVRGTAYEYDANSSYKYLTTNTSNTEQGMTRAVGLDYATSCYYYDGSSDSISVLSFKRAPGFFDIAAYTGTGVVRTVNHNLKVVPELIIVKGRSATSNWKVWHKNFGAATNVAARLNANFAAAVNEAQWGGLPTATTFSVGNDSEINASSATYIAYLFASCPGVSSVGSYTGNGSNQTINCGFAAGARFVLIKRTDSTGDWYIWNTTRGIVAGNDPHLSLNTTDTEVITDDSVDPASSGFIVNQVAATNINVNAATYIYLAIA